MADYYPIIRDLQSRVAPLISLKVAAQRHVRRLLKKPFEIEFEILNHLEMGDRCIMDIGGNRGQSIDAIRLFQPDCMIHSFEPNADLADLLIKRFQKDTNVLIHKAGLGDEALTSPLYIPYYRNFLYDGLASFKRDEAEDWLNADTVWRFNPNHVRIKEAVCNILVGDTLSLSPGFVKIDVQGFEMNVLAGAEKTITAHKPIILMENNPAGDEWLQSRNWLAVSYTANGIEDGGGDNNTLYLHPESPEHMALMQNHKSK